MKIYNQLSELPVFQKAVLTIGSFDGVHCGHQKIIAQVRALAQEIGGESVLITFHPHPRLVLYPNDRSLRLLNTIDEKANLMDFYGIDHLVVIPFTKAFSQQAPEAYIEDFLMDKFNPAYIVIGYDHHFGLNRKGNIELLRQYEAKGHFQIREIEKQEVDNIGVSSSKIRNAVQEGAVKTAAQLLGHPYSLSGIVVHGQHIGHELGYPTANIEHRDLHKLVPPFGIYAVRVLHQDESYGGMLYIGDRPTLENHDNPTIEVNIFDFNKNIYGDQLKIEFVDYIRPDMRFEGLDQLSVQLGEDKKSALRILSNQQEELLSLKKKRVESAPLVAVVILNYNGQDYLEKFLPTLLQSTYSNFEIHVADNGSTDASLELLQQRFPEVIVHNLKINHGFAKGYNEALKLVKADYFVLLNSDVEVTKNWIEPIIELMESDPSIAATQPKIRSFEDRSSFEYAGASGGWMDSWGIPFCRGRLFEHLEKDQGQYDQTEEIFWASGAAFFVRADLFGKIGGFDADYFAHMEEIDLCWRLKRAGYKIMVQPQSVVYHVGGGTLNYGSPRKTFLNFRNSYSTLVKNVESSRLIWLLPLRLVIDGGAGLLFLFQGKFIHIWAIIRAHWAFFGNVSQLRKKRKQVQELVDKVSIHPQTNRAGIYSGSLIWQYYFLRKKTFRHLGKQ